MTVGVNWVPPFMLACSREITLHIVVPVLVSSALYKDTSNMSHDSCQPPSLSFFILISFRNTKTDLWGSCPCKCDKWYLLVLSKCLLTNCVFSCVFFLAGAGLSMLHQTVQSVVWSCTGFVSLKQNYHFDDKCICACY